MLACWSYHTCRNGRERGDGGGVHGGARGGGFRYAVHPVLSRLADFVRSSPSLRRCAHAAVRLIPDRPYTLNIKNLGPVRIRMRRHRHLLWEKVAHNDELTLAMFQRLIRPGDTVYDIGANIGLYSRIMLRWFQAGRIIAFE